MKNRTAKKLIAGTGRDSRRFRLSRLAAALAACSLLGAGTAQAILIQDAPNEPTNNTLAGATPGTVLDQFQGCVGNECPPLFTANDVDFVGFLGLLSGATYTLSLARILDTGAPVEFDLYRNANTSIDETHTLSSGTFDVTGLTGLTALKVGMHLSTGTVSLCCEGYSVQIFQTQGPGASVPEPASVALVAAGLVAAFAARRRKRI